MKKFLALLISILTLSLCLTGCDGVKPVTGYQGAVNESTNGTFAVEKGAYLYFVNGIGDMTGDNTMGKVEKGALLRVKLDDIGKDTATYEMVIPKLMNTASANSGVYIFGDTVYYGTPYDGKDKTSTVRSDFTDFRTFDLATAKSKRIVFETKTVKRYSFLQKGNEVYLAYEINYTEGSATVSAFKVYNAKTGKEVFSVDGYKNLLADDKSGKVFYSKVAHNEQLEQDEAFDEIYYYNVGDTESELLFSGCGSNGLGYDDRSEDSYKKKILPYSDFSGLTVTLIKNTGSLFVFKVSAIDQNYGNAYYFGLETSNIDLTKLDLTKAVKEVADTENPLVEMGMTDAFIDSALTANAIYKSLKEVYYVENSNYLKGLVKFDYTELNSFSHGRTLIANNDEGLNISFVDDSFEYIYLATTAGVYSRIKLDGSQTELKKITPVESKSVTAWFAPRVIGNNFICVFSGDFYKDYVYAIDISKIDDETIADGEEKTKYEQYLEKHKTATRESILELHATLFGKMTEADKDAFTTKLDKDYPVEEDKE